MSPRLKFNPAGFNDILRRPATEAWVTATAEDIARRAGDGYVASTRQGRSRVRSIVFADTWKARRDNARNNTLVRVMG